MHWKPSETSGIKWNKVEVFLVVHDRQPGLSEQRLLTFVSNRVMLKLNAPPMSRKSNYFELVQGAAAAILRRPLDGCHWSSLASTWGPKLRLIWQAPARRRYWLFFVISVIHHVIPSVNFGRSHPLLFIQSIEREQSASQISILLLQCWLSGPNS